MTKYRFLGILLGMIVTFTGCSQKADMNLTRKSLSGLSNSIPMYADRFSFAPQKAPPHHGNGGTGVPNCAGSKPAVTCRNASRPLIINTYDGSGQSTHPKVLYFDKGWNGWKYWMSYTPYPNTVDKYENPSLCVSNDGKTWFNPRGLKNPVIAAPFDAGRGGHNSDPQIVMNGKIMELWYRYNPARKNGRSADSSVNLIYRTVSSDGIRWSRPELIFHGKYKYFSPAVLRNGGKYFVWFSDLDGKLYFTRGGGAGNWSFPVATDLKIKGFSVWHQDVIKTGRGFEIVFCAYRNGDFDQNSQCLYYSVSQDGIHFKKPVKVLSPSAGKFQLDNRMIYRSSLVKAGNSVKLYYSAMNSQKKWHIFLTELQYG